MIKQTRHLILALALTAITNLSASAQSIDQELAALRTFLKVPSSTSIVTSQDPLPETAPIKVFIAAGNDADYRFFVKNIDKWNEKDGATFRTIMVVSDLDSADVILVRNRKIGKQPLSGTQPLYPLESYSYIIVRKSDQLERVWRLVVVDVYVDLSHKTKNFAVLTEFFKRLKTRNKSP